MNINPEGGTVKSIQFELEMVNHHEPEIPDQTPTKHSLPGSSLHDQSEHDVESVSKKKEIEQHLSEINSLKLEMKEMQIR